jgi:hypothetical protein
MAEPASKTDLLKRQADLMGLTMDSVFTDDQAKEVLQGKITDAYLVKMKFEIDNKTGIILILTSSIRKHIMEIYVVIGNSPIFRRIRTFADYVQISTDLADIGKTEGMDPAISETVGRIIYRTFTKEKLEEFLPVWEKKDPSRLSELLEPAIVNGTKAGRVKLVAEIDKISSAKFRYENPMKGIILPIPKPLDEMPAAPDLSSAPAMPTGELSAIDRQIQQLRQGFTKEVTMKTVISPISGVEFDNLVVGQEILFRIPTETAEGMANASLLGAIDETGKISKEPLVGKFKGIASAKNEYHIFAEGPNQYLFHSIEESPVKVAVPKALTASAQNTDKSGGSGTASAKKKTAEAPKTGNLYSLIGAFVALILIALLIFILML